MSLTPRRIFELMAADGLCSNREADHVASLLEAIDADSALTSNYLLDKFQRNIVANGAMSNQQAAAFCEALSTRAGGSAATDSVFLQTAKRRLATRGAGRLHEIDDIVESLLLKAVVAAGCAYPLDAVEAELLAIGLNGRLTVSDGDQTVEFVATGGGTFTDGAAPAGVSTQTAAGLDFSTGKKVIEHQVVLHEALSGGTVTDVTRAVTAIANPDFTNLFSIIVQNNALDGTWKVGTGDGFGANTIAAGLVTSPTSIAMVVDADAGNIYVRYNGTNYHTTAATFPSNTIALCSGGEVNALPAANIGKITRWRVETVAANFLGSYPAGLTDPCGNAV